MNYRVRELKTSLHSGWHCAKCGKEITKTIFVYLDIFYCSKLCIMLKELRGQIK